MVGIGGNTKATFQLKESQKNAIGEYVATWTDCLTVSGWLDLSTGDSKHTVFYAKTQESSHVFICDYVDLAAAGIESDNARVVINGKAYEIMLIDNPMEMNEQLEIYLRFIGGQ